VRGGDDFVTTTDAACLQGQSQRIGARRHPKAVCGAAVRGKLLFEQPNVLAENKIAARQHGGHRGIHVGPNQSVLRGKVYKRDRLCMHGQVLSRRPSKTIGRRMLHQPTIGVILV
jgi:hypothetical protein